MTSKERVKAALTRSSIPDRTPLQFDLCRSLIDHFARELGIEAEYALSYYEDLTYRISANEIRITLGSDVCVVGGTVAEGFKPIPVENDVTLNEFGMKMKPTELYVEVVEPPLKDIDSTADIRSYPFPDPFAPGRFNAASQDVDRFGLDYFVIGDCELSLFELSWQLTGLETYLIALAGEEEWVERLNDRVEGWTLGLAEQLTDLKVDALWFGEDLGTQTSTLISPELWRERFKPRYKRMFDRIRGKHPDIILIMHSDGAVAPLLDDFIEIGVQVYNPVQPNVPHSDPTELKDRYGDRLAFFGGIDQQELLPAGDDQAIRREVTNRCRILGEGGGYLAAPAHIIQADVSPNAVKKMIESVRSSS